MQLSFKKQTATQSRNEIEVEELSGDEFLERPEDLTVPIKKEDENRVYEIIELQTAFPPNCAEWKNVTIQGIFVKSFKGVARSGKGKNSSQVYRILPIELSDLIDESKRIKVSIWGAAIEIFKSVSPRISDQLILKGVTIHKFDEGVAGRHRLLPIEVNCNAGSSQDVMKVNLAIKRKIKFWWLNEITALQDYEEISLDLWRQSQIQKKT